MKVVEKFVSINGEGVRSGELAVFIRFKGCNLRCGYCDTMWANEGKTPYEELTPEEIVAYIRSTGVRNVTLTGGEPLLQNGQEMKRLLNLILAGQNLRVEIETNGAVDLAPYCDGYRPVFTMDWKLPSSGCEAAMLPDNLDRLREEDTVKFVVGSEQDLLCAEELVRKSNLTEKCHVYLSPVFGQIEPEQIVAFMITHRMNDVRLQLQMHKMIWDPDRRGV